MPAIPGAVRRVWQPWCRIRSVSCSLWVSIASAAGCKQGAVAGRARQCTELLASSGPAFIKGRQALLNVPTSCRAVVDELAGCKPAAGFDSELAMACIEEEPGGRRWVRSYAQSIVNRFSAAHLGQVHRAARMAKRGGGEGAASGLREQISSISTSCAHRRAG